MYYYVILAAVVLFMVPGAGLGQTTAPTTKPSAGLELSIQCEAPEVVAGYAVTVKVVLSNRSDKLMAFNSTRTDGDIGLRMTSGGVPATRTAYGIRQAEFRERSVNTGRQTITLAPGEKWEYELNLTRYFDLTLPGKYEVVANHEVWADGVDGNRTEVLVSSPLLVRMTAPDRAIANKPEKKAR